MSDKQPAIDISKFTKVDVCDLDSAEMVPEETAGRLLVHKYPTETESEGGVVIPKDSQKPPPCLAWIVKVCEEAEKFDVGDTIMAAEHAFQDALTPLDPNPETGKESVFYINARDCVLLYKKGK